MVSPLFSQRQQPSQQARKLAMTSVTPRDKLSRILLIQTSVICCVCSLVAFYLGAVLGSFAAGSNSSNVECFTASQVQEKINEALKNAEEEFLKSNDNSHVSKGSRDTNARFPEGMHRIVTGMGHMDRNAFNQKFDLGVPYDPSQRNNDKVLLLYNSESAIPRKNHRKFKEAKSQTAIPFFSPEEATVNCDFLHIILQETKETRRQCTAIVGQYEAFHIQKFMRLPVKGPLDPQLPLRLVNRGAQPNGRKSLQPPSLDKSYEHWQSLVSYIGHLDEVLKTLKPIAEKVAFQNSIIVQVVNFGQVELFLNFLCSAKRRGHDTSNILIFVTDAESRDIIQAAGGVTVFYDETIFGGMPARAAGRYGDPVFMRMMMTKIYCVHLIVLLGYDVLFQDVDVVWYRNPLPYFHDKNSSDANFDVYFQDDGNHAIYYSPYSPNTGFYYVRNNERTLFFLNSLLMAGDLVLQSRSHQVALVAVLQEHASMYGLKVKIFSRDEDTFPGGHAFHWRLSFMRKLFDGTAHPYIFHMSWTNSHVNKRKFFQQMGEWYLQDECTDKTVNEILGVEQGNQTSGRDEKQDITSLCCAEEPIIICHYKDKPSKIRCDKSPAIDKFGRSFW